MSETNATLTVPLDQIPILLESEPLEPIVRCGVLYLGTAPSNTGLDSLDAAQEPFSYRYPVDGTNTVRGIDGVLFVYDTGIQLTFTRQPNAAIFFPIASLVYCASLRFSVIEHDQTKSIPMVDWRFMPLDSLVANKSRHPPLFSLIVRRTQVLPGDECHCFITKSVDAAFSLVRAISQVYANIKLGALCLKSPVFYQLDRFGRKVSETTGAIYISPANGDDSQTDRNRLIDKSIMRRYLLNSTLGGYFYRTDASLIEQWQLWDDDDDLIETRPRPPASPFGLHEGLYHDDTTHEIQKYLRQMEDEEHDSSCACSSQSCSSIPSSSSIDHSQNNRSRRHSQKQKSSTDDTDQYTDSYTNLHVSSFEPDLTPNNTHKNKVKKKKKHPIIIEKVVPRVPKTIPILNPILPKRSSNISNYEDESVVESLVKSDIPSFSYRINERGEKITKEGNRIVFMDVIRPNINNDNNNTTAIDPSLYGSSKTRSRSRRKYQTTRIPVVNIQSIQQFIDEKNSQNQRYKTKSNSDNSVDRVSPINHLTTKDMIEVIDEYFNDYKRPLNNHETQSINDRIESSHEQNSSRKNSIVSLTNNSINRARHRRSHSTINYVERTSIPSSCSTSTSAILKPMPSTLTDEKVDQYVSNIYGTTKSITSTASSKTNEKQKTLSNNPSVTNSAYRSTFRYMQSSINSNLLRQLHDAY